MKVSDVLRQIADLVDKRKVSEADVHKVLNGALINGSGVYENGMLRVGKGIMNLPVVTSIKWPEPKIVASSPLKLESTVKATKERAPAPKPSE